MKKKYLLFVYFIASIMILTLSFYLIKHLDPQFINSLLGINTFESEDDAIENNFASENSIILNSGNSGSSCVIISGYASLTDSNEKRLYLAVKSSAEKITDEKHKNSGYYLLSPITISGVNLSPSQIKKVIYAFQFDNPEIFWLSNVFNYIHSQNKTIIKLTSIFSKSEKEKAAKKFNEKISEIKSKASVLPNEYEKELFVHDYLIDNCTYKKNSSLNNYKIYTAYGCLVEKEAVCEGYSKAMQILLCNLGIKCQTVTGSREKEDHMWNVAKIDNNWYHVDVTWDCAGELQKYDYFNLSDELIKKTHTVNSVVTETSDFSQDKKYNFELPKCNSMEKNYMEINCVKIENLGDETRQKIIKKLISLASENKKMIHLMIKNNYDNYKAKLLSEEPLLYFECLKNANSSLLNSHKLSTTQSQFLENKNQNVITLKLIYE